ncbi:hypothetical protein [Xaviernesmea oryzae]|nr:hypothetical protein [Xaviernesmea oryzae]SEL61035.1 hypothetical protein SAMN04487976_11094 [Xaviernesmea oryzae]
MTNNDVTEMRQSQPERDSVRQRARAFTSLLLLGLTRGCRVL